MITITTMMDRTGFGDEYSLYKHIDIDNIRTFNEAVPGSAKKIFKPWADRFDETNVGGVETDADEQLIIFIPFTGLVKLKSIAIRGLGEHAPSHMKAYINREDIDFSTVESVNPPDQEWELVDTLLNPGNEIPEYPTKLVKFGSLRNLTLFFPSNVTNDEVTTLLYIGLKGEWTKVNRDPVITIYEAAANPADHVAIPGVKEEMGGASGIQ
ncbi:hypothetical protein HDU98_011211 [Podochytrium sp. JEL0797]|nr:hypothetical protein HDU98_011211 [Podochytrium sp. JEL0797]